MKSELLLRIRDAETAASKRVEQAEADAKRILSDARRKADQVVAEGKEHADATYHAQLAQVRAEADEAAKKTTAGGKRKATALRKSFEEGVDGVTGRVQKLFEERLA